MTSHKRKVAFYSVISVIICMVLVSVAIFFEAYSESFDEISMILKVLFFVALVSVYTNWKENHWLHFWIIWDVIKRLPCVIVPVIIYAISFYVILQIFKNLTTIGFVEQIAWSLLVSSVFAVYCFASAVRGIKDGDYMFYNSLNRSINEMSLPEFSQVMVGMLIIVALQFFTYFEVKVKGSDEISLHFGCKIMSYKSSCKQISEIINFIITSFVMMWLIIISLQHEHQENSES
ncbi:MAG: hypothetical protein RLN62_05680 [Rickettsiales bacterium]